MAYAVLHAKHLGMLKVPPKARGPVLKPKKLFFLVLPTFP